MGGGFGSKFGAGVEGGLAAKLSQAAKAPVKLTRNHSHTVDFHFVVDHRPLEDRFHNCRESAIAFGSRAKDNIFRPDDGHSVLAESKK